MLLNLPEKYLASLLPAKVVALDERGLLQAFISGYQDRLEDLRSYVKKFHALIDPAGLGDETVVLASVRSEQGLVFLRSLDVDETTPADAADLPAWVAATLAVEPEDVVSAARGSDLLRESGAPTLYLLAATVGAVLHQRIGTQDEDTTAVFVKFLQTYFDRLKIKGTAQSFAALGHLLGFDEVSVQSLWGRLSPRIANDAGDGRNNPDFSPMPEFDVRQALGLFYNPHEFRDGPFFEWTGTVSPHLSNTAFYSQVVNGFNPWVRVTVLNQTDVSVDADGTMANHPAEGAYPLTGGSPHTKAGVTIAGTPFRFEAVAEGESFNGLVVQVLEFTDTGTSADRLLRIYDRLSGIKYRTSFYDLGLAVTEETSVELFGSPTMRRNATLVANPGAAVSPYRPWSAGTTSYTLDPFDYTIRPGSPTTPVQARVQAARTDLQLDSTALLAAANQSAQVFEEVRPATRYPRSVGAGYLNSDGAGLAIYRQVEPLFAVSLASGSYGGYAIKAPQGAHQGRVEILPPGATEFVPVDAQLSVGGIVVTYTGPGFSGTHNLSTDQWQFATDVDEAVPGTVVAIIWEPTDSELVRLPEPGQASAWTRSYVGGGTATLSRNFNSFANWTVPAGYQVDLIGDNGYQVFDDVYPGQGIYANLSGQAEFGKLVSRESFDWVAGSSYSMAVMLAGNHQVGDSVVEVRFAGTSIPVARTVSAGFSLTTLTHTAATTFSGVVEIETVSGVVGAGALYTQGTLTNTTTSTVLLNEDLNRFPAPALSVTVVPANAGQQRAEDEPDGQNIESTDDVPWRRDLTLGGELVNADVYCPAADDLLRVDVSDEVAVKDQDGVEYRVYSVDSETQPPRMVQVAVPTLEGYEPGQLAVGYKGTLKSLSDVEASFWSTGSAYPDERTSGVAPYRALGGLFSTGTAHLYHVGLVHGVLVADAPAFNASHHRDGLAYWLPFNEHPEEGLQPHDRSSFATDPAVTGLSQSARVWDADHGWVLRVLANDVVSTTAHRGMVDDFAWSGWLKFSSLAAAASQAIGVDGGNRTVTSRFAATRNILRVGSLEFGISTASGTPYFGLCTGGVFSSSLRVQMTLGSAMFIGVSVSDGTAQLYKSADLATAVTAVGSGVAVVTDADDMDAITVSGGLRDTTIHDLRVWAQPKSLADFKKVHSYQPTETACLYPLALVESVNHQDKRAFKVLPNGLVVLDTPPGSVRKEAQTRVRRYDGGGRYVGSPEFNEVGLGGGDPVLPTTWLLGGRQQYLLAATGTTVSSGTYGFTGTNSAFDVALDRDSVALSPDTSAVPAVSLNPARDRIWIIGDEVSSNGSMVAPVYEVGVEAVGVNGTLVVSRTVRADYHDQPTGSISLVASGTNRVSVDTSGTAYTRTGCPSLPATPAYIYAHSLLLESVLDVMADVDEENPRWEDQNTFGMGQLPVPLAVLPGNGILSFANGAVGETLEVGVYRLRLDVGNLGTVDADFDGFSIEITIGDTILPRRVLVDLTGTNFRQWEEFEFTLDKEVVGAYSLEIAVLNAQHDVSRGTSRRLVVYGYELRCLKTQLFKVTVEATGSADPVATNLPVSTSPAGSVGAEAGGWRVAISASGAQVGWQHESKFYPDLSTLPSASLLTANTAFRREDHYVKAGEDSTSDSFTSPVVDPALEIA